MKKIKIIFINKGSLPLHVECKNGGLPGYEKFQVKKKSEIKVFSGRYQFCLYYDCTNIEINSNLNGLLELGEVNSPFGSEFKAKMLLLNYPERSVKIVCKEKISLASLLEGI